MLSDDALDVPGEGAVFTFGKSRFADNAPSHFFIRKDPIVDVACGDEHTVVVCRRGRAFSFGRNGWGELGLGHKSAIARPNCIKSLKSVKTVHVACGRAHTLFLTDTGDVYSCGNNDEGQLGLGDLESRETPEKLDLPENIRQLSAGFNHSAALAESGRVYVWGNNKDGQLGLGELIYSVNQPTNLNLDMKATQVSCGYYHTFVLFENGSLIGFGEAEFGKLGLGSEKPVFLPTPIQTEVPMKYVAGGASHSAAISTEGKLYMWGCNEYGQCGFNSVESLPKPTLVPFDAVKIVSLGDTHTAAITENGELFTFGNNRHGKLALKDAENVFEPAKIVKFDGFVVYKVSCGGCHTMVLAAPQGRINGSEVDQKLWELYDGASSVSTETFKAALPPLRKLSGVSVTPLSPKPKPEIPLKPSSALTFKIDEHNGQGQSPEKSPDKAKSAPEVLLKTELQASKSSHSFKRLHFEPNYETDDSRTDFSMSRFGGSELSSVCAKCKNREPFESWYIRHKEDMTFLSSQIYDAGRNLKNVIQRVESYFNCKEYHSVNHLMCPSDTENTSNSDVCTGPVIVARRPCNLHSREFIVEGRKIEIGEFDCKSIGDGPGVVYYPREPRELEQGGGDATVQSTPESKPEHRTNGKGQGSRFFPKIKITQSHMERTVPVRQNVAKSKSCTIL